ncbi:MAG: dihydropteroate synthase [Chthoniobacterales bacterium]
MIWRTSRRAFDLGERGVIMGILNVTPDSFSDGGRHNAVDAAVTHALRMIAEGAEIIDVGGESTRPGAAEVPAGEEIRRVVPVIEKLRAATDTAISIDTAKASVARAAVEAGAEIINDVSAMTGDPEMAAVAAQTKCGVVLMHMRGTPRTMQESPHYDDVLREVGEYLAGRITAARDAGIAADRISIDPGLGFGKTPEHNWELVAGLQSFASLGQPVLLGASRKSFLKDLPGCAEPTERDVVTAASTLTRSCDCRVGRRKSC